MARRAALLLDCISLCICISPGSILVAENEVPVARVLGLPIAACGALHSIVFVFPPVFIIPSEFVFNCVQPLQQRMKSLWLESWVYP